MRRRPRWHCMPSTTTAGSTSPSTSSGVVPTTRDPPSSEANEHDPRVHRAGTEERVLLGRATARGAGGVPERPSPMPAASWAGGWRARRSLPGRLRRVVGTLQTAKYALDGYLGDADRGDAQLRLHLAQAGPPAQGTLVMLASYSGETEDTVAALRFARQAGATTSASSRAATRRSAARATTRSSTGRRRSSRRRSRRCCCSPRA